MPTRLPMLTLRARPSMDSVAATTTEATTDPTPTASASAPTPPSAIVHKPLSAIQRFGSTFFNRKTVVTSAAKATEPVHEPPKTRLKRNSTSALPNGGPPRRGSTESDLLSSLPAGDLSKLITKHSRSSRNLINLSAAPLAVDVPTATLPVATKEDDAREPVVPTVTLIPHRPPTDQHSSSGSTTTHAPRRPPLSKKVSANEAALSSIVIGTSPLPKGRTSRNIAHFDRAKVDSFGAGAEPPPSLETQRSARDDSSASSDGVVYTGQHVLNRFSAELMPFEKQEILAFSEVYYYSSIGVKRRRQNGRVVSPTLGVESLGEAPDKSASDGSENDSQTPKGEVFNDGYDDDRGDYVMLMQDHLAYRYEVLHPLGSGSFGQVVCCLDHVTKAKVAVKVIRNRKKYKEQALIEIQVLSLLQQQAASGSTRHVVQMVDHFTFRNHLCISFELLGMNLYDYLKLRFFQGMSMANIRAVATQLLTGLVELRTKHIIHCDLKPENVLIRAPLQCFAAGPGYSSVAYANVPVESICLIDFGSSCLDHSTVYTYIQSRFYRSPEVILGHAYGTAIDMWSFGCILVELHTGHPIFAGENETEQLLCMMEILGVPPASYLTKCKRRKYFFQEEAVPPSGENAPGSEPAPATTVTYRPMTFTNSRGRKRVPGVRDLGFVIKSDDAAFIALVKKCFTWDPNDRLTPEAALLEPWILAKNANMSSDE